MEVKESPPICSPPGTLGSLRSAHHSDCSPLRLTHHSDSLMLCHPPGGVFLGWAVLVWAVLG